VAEVNVLIAVPSVDSRALTTEAMQAKFIGDGDGFGLLDALGDSELRRALRSEPAPSRAMTDTPTINTPTASTTPIIFFVFMWTIRLNLLLSF
jgi:hypothetical protein